MQLRRLLSVTLALATLVGPLAGVAHAAVSGSVTTAPFMAPAPAVGMPLLAVLVVLLAVGGAYLTRRAGGGAIATLGVVAVLTALAGLAYASNGTTITIKDAQCGMQAVNPFNPTVPYTLLSNCPNPIQIISIQLNCEDPPPPTPCSVGQVLTTGQSCGLPTCDPP